MPDRDYYEVLGISKTATADQIKRAYRGLAKKHHPDRNPGDKSAESRFKEVQAAYEVLSDPEKRKLYDQFGRADASGPSAGWRSGPSGSRVYTWKSGGGPDIPVDDLDDLFNIFSGSAGGQGGSGSMFDQFFMQGGGRRGAAAETTAASGSDIEYPVDLTFEQAVWGTKMDLTLADQNTGDAQRISVSIPPGVADGQRIRVRGKGQPGAGRSRSGDLYIVCRIQPHRFFRRIDNDIYIELPLTLSEAALGTKVEIPTLGGRTMLTVPPGTPSGAKLRLKDQGVKPASGKPQGHQYAVVRIVPPKNPTPDQRQLLEQLRQTETESPRRGIWG
jgi:curved DNA-binding protein